MIIKSVKDASITTHNPWIVETDWLETQLNEPGLVVLDGSFHLPASGRDGYSEFQEARIPGAQFFDIDLIADQSVDLFHNSCSFSEMDSASARGYLTIIERTCRRYFSHINHEVRFKIRNSDGSTSVNIIGSEMIPNPVLFKRIFKKPRVFCLPEDRPFPAFEYLYERMRE